MNHEILNKLRCPETGNRLIHKDNWLQSTDGIIRYPIIDGIPCLLPRNAIATHAGYSDLMTDNDRFRTQCSVITKVEIEKYLNGMLVPTCGNLYRGVKLSRYPIPPFPKELANYGMLLDIGCNWGRWSLAAALAGHQVVGVDIHLESLRMAKAIAEEMGVRPLPTFILADARNLPFEGASFDSVFSYSVLQHFSKSNARLILHEIGRILRTGGMGMVQMPNECALRSLLILARRGFSEGIEFDVRYYSITELMKLFQETIGNSDWTVDCFLGLNVHRWDKDLMRWPAKCILEIAELLRRCAGAFPPMGRLADSVFISAVKGESTKSHSNV